MDSRLRLLVAGSVVRALGLSLVGPFLTLYLRNVLHLGYAEVGGLVVAVGVAPVLLSLAGGFVTDRWGRRPVVIAALFAETGSLFGLAEGIHLGSLAVVAVAASAAYLAGGAMGPAVSAYVADLTEGSQRTTVFTWTRVGWNAGFAIGVTTAGFVIAFAGFEAAALAAAAVSAAGTAVLAAWLGPSPYDGRLRPRGPDGRGRPLIDSLRVMGRDRLFLLVNVASFFAVLAESQWAFAFPIFVNQRLGIGYSLLGLGLALNGLLVVFGQPPVTRWALGRRHSSLWIVGLALYVVGFLALGVDAEVGIGSLAAFFVIVIVLTMGENVSSPPAQTLPSNMAPPEEVGSYNGAANTVFGVAQLASSLFGGFMLATIADPVALWAVLMLPAVPATLLFYRAGHRLRPEVNRA